MGNRQALMPDTSSMLEALGRIVPDPEKRVYVLMDGARFDDLPGMLTSGALYHRSLYRNVQDAELVRAGPWLIDPYRLPDPTFNAWGGLPADSNGDDAIAADARAALREPQAETGGPFDGEPHATDPQKQLEAVIQLIGDAPAAVFWIGDASLTEPVLWRHLRTLNMVLIPKEYDSGGAPPPAEGDETHDAMMFRQGDGNVLAEVLPVLDVAQFARVFGPARVLMFMAPDHPGSDGSPIRRAVLPSDAPPAQGGLLKLSMAQMAGIDAARLERSQLRITRYLRDAAPEQTAKMSDAQLAGATARWMDEARGHGAQSEAALGRWSYLQLITVGEIGKKREVVEYLRQPHPERTTDQRVQDLMHMAAFNAAGG
jgi:hypothetical protein